MNIVKYAERKIWFYIIDFTFRVFISEISALDFAYLLWLVCEYSPFLYGSNILYL